MNRFILGFLSICALALVIGPTANPNSKQESIWQFAANTAAGNNGVLIIETYSASSMPTPPANNSAMQPLPGNPGVEVAPESNSLATSSQPISVEQDTMLLEQNE